MTSVARDPIPDDPSRPTDPTWEELGQALRECGLDWIDLGTWGPAEPWDCDLPPDPTREDDATWAELSGCWGLGPDPDDLDVTPMFARGAAMEGGAR